MSRATAAKGKFPYPHRTVAESDRDRKAGCTCRYVEDDEFCDWCPIIKALSA